MSIINEYDPWDWGYLFKVEEYVFDAMINKMSDYKDYLFVKGKEFSDNKSLYAQATNTTDNNEYVAFFVDGDENFFIYIHGKNDACSLRYCDELINVDSINLDGFGLAVFEWFINDEKNQYFKLGGLAGTGKTTLIANIYKKLYLKKSKVAYAAYTGKAADVLRKKGMSATTIHGMMYMPIKDKETGELIRFDYVGIDQKNKINHRR